MWINYTYMNTNLLKTIHMLYSGAASELGRQISTDPKSPGGPLTIAEEAVDQLQENEKLVAGKTDFLTV